MPISNQPIHPPPIQPSNNPLNANSTDSNVPGVSGTNAGILSTFLTSGSGVGVFGGGAIGVQGTSQAGTGVLGQSESKTNAAIHGTSTAFDAVVGETSSNGNAGVTGRALANGAVGIYGDGTKGQYAGKFDGTVQVNGDHHCTGTLYAQVDVVLGSDCAEDFEIAPVAEVEPGTVMVLDDNGALRPSDLGYDKKVAGVISGAGDYKPGLILGRSDSPQKRMPLALVGKVYCKVDAQYAPIEVGDLLTTSPTPGHAMRALDPLKAFGAVIGKALRPLGSGQALVPILIALQ